MWLNAQENIMKTFEQLSADFNKFATNYTKIVTGAWKAFPLNPEDANEGYTRLKTVFQEESEKTSAMWKTYQSSLVGTATTEEIETANSHAKELLKTAGLSFFALLPGTFFILPALIIFAKEKDVDLIPAALRKSFPDSFRHV